MNRRACIYVAGGETLIGRALIERLQHEGSHELVGLPPCEPDLTCAEDVADFFARARPEYVFVAAGPTGGIGANQRRPADLMRDNLVSAANVIDQAARNGVRKLLYLASSCAYPKHAPPPMRPEALLTGPLEPTSEPYALAKLAGMKLCQAYRRQYGSRFITAFPANAFGPHDDFDLQSGHVIPSLMRRMYEAKQRGDDAISLWGTGTPRREFIYASAVADACVFVMRHYDGEAPINIGSGWEYSIADTGRMIADVVGYRGTLRFDSSHPDGMPRKALDSTPLFALGWRPRTDFRAALEATYAWFTRTLSRPQQGLVKAAA